MAYSKFKLADVLKQFQLTTDDTQDLFPDIKPVEASDWLKTTLEQNLTLAKRIATEKARSEMIVSPLLIEVWRRMQPDVGFFSGVEFPVDDEQGLSGVCDYLFTRAREQSVIKAPVLPVVEAKKENLRPGMGQCIAEMVAARIFNEREETPVANIYGAVTTGTNWQFMRLDGGIVRVDSRERLLNGTGLILGILMHIVSGKA